MTLNYLDLLSKIRYMSEEEQKLLLFIFIDSFNELSHKKPTKDNLAQKETYLFLINLFTDHENKLFDSKNIVFKYAKERLNELMKRSS